MQILYSEFLPDLKYTSPILDTCFINWIEIVIIALLNITLKYKNAAEKEKNVAATLVILLQQFKMSLKHKYGDETYQKVSVTLEMGLQHYKK